jgi:hypothetical protein
MPAVPYVFRPVKSGDVQLRPFKAYKSYTLQSNTDYSSSGYRVHDAIYKRPPIHVGVDSYNYPINASDGTNQHVVWSNIDHRYYHYPYDISRCHELTNNRVTEKYLNISASILTIPYFDIGEKIKPGSVNINGIVNGINILLQDDGHGNLRDMAILTASFASASSQILYASFNNAFRDTEVGSNLSLLNVKVDNINVNATVNNVRLTEGLELHTNINTSSPNDLDSRSGYLGFIPTSTAGYVQIPHHDIFNRFNRTDHWTISFWYRQALNKYNNNGTIISKAFQRTNTQIINGVRSFVTQSITPPVDASIVGSYNQIQTPFHIFTDTVGSTDCICFKASNGSSELFISGAISYSTTLSWEHFAFVNDGEFVRMYINGNLHPLSGSLPLTGSTANNADVMMFSANTQFDNPIDNAYLGEVRMYDYALSTSEIQSLSNRHYISASLYQTNVAGNIFYRNGQIVLSSPLSKYHSGSSFFSNEWTASWKGTHTIYENEVMVRIPADQFNYSVNPTVTYRPAMAVDSTSEIEKQNGPGSLYKSIFTGSLAKPYITTIGLYNDKAQLLAVGKLAQPVQKRDDVDMNIIVRWDY